MIQINSDDEDPTKNQEPSAESENPPDIVVENQDDNLLGQIDDYGVFHTPGDGLCGYHVITFMLKVNLFYLLFIKNFHSWYKKWGSLSRKATLQWRKNHFVPVYRFVIACLNHFGYNRGTRVSRQTFTAEQRLLFITKTPLILYDDEVESSLYDHAGM